MSERPTLHEIANMPLSETVSAIRKYYDPKWGEAGPEEGEREYAVTIFYQTVSEDETVITVRADSPEQAEKKAEEIWDEDRSYDEELTHSRAEEVGAE